MDFYSFDPNLSTVNKVQREYWMAKQVLKKKLGKEEDQHVIAGDTDIDSKLAQYDSIQGTCVTLLKELEKYHSCICLLARDENNLGRFLKEQGQRDPTKAGKMMIAVGKALCYSAQQRLQMRHPLSRLREDVETFRQRAIADTNLSVKKMEEERTHYRASLLWMRDNAATLDPEQYRKLEKFRKVQNEVRVNKEKFDRLKWAVCQKIDLLSASRSNLFSNTLVPYQDELLNFWDKTARNMAAVLESFNGYQHYEFKLLKDLNPMQLSEPGDDSKKLKEIKDGEDDDALIDLDGSKNEDGNEYGENPFEDAMDALDLQDKNESSSKEDKSPTTSDFLGDISSNQGTSKEEIDLWNDLIGGDEQDSKGEFANQWKTAFGEFETASVSQELNDIEKDMLNLLKPAERTPQQQHEQQQVGAQNDNFKGFLPSQLLDMHFQQSMTPQMGQVPMPPNYNSLMPMSQNQGMFPQQQPPMMLGQQGLTNFGMPGPMHPGGQMIPPQGQPTLGGLPSVPMQGDRTANKGKADWYNLFAELDPLQNPDALGKKESDKSNEDGRAC